MIWYTTPGDEHLRSWPRIYWLVSGTPNTATGVVVCTVDALCWSYLNLVSTCWFLISSRYATPECCRLGYWQAVTTVQDGYQVQGEVVGYLLCFRFWASIFNLIGLDSIHSGSVSAHLFQPWTFATPTKDQHKFAWATADSWIAYPFQFRTYYNTTLCVTWLTYHSIIVSGNETFGLKLQPTSFILFFYLIQHGSWRKTHELWCFACPLWIE